MFRLLFTLVFLLSGFCLQAQMISYEPELTGAIPDIDTNKPVGTLDGGVSVNLTGAAT